MNHHQQILKVVSIGRSGTSFTTNWLEACGLPMGTDYLPPAVGNEKGFYEDREFFTLHEDILRQNGKVTPLLRIGEELSVSPVIVERAEALLAARAEAFPQWGWKVPYTSLVLPMWHALVPEARLLVLFRHYSFVVHSYARMLRERDRHDRKTNLMGWAYRRLYRLRHGSYEPRTPDDYLQSWIQYNTKILSHLRQLRPEQYVVAESMSVIRQSAQLYDRLTGDMGFQLTYVSPETIFDPALFGAKQKPEFRFSPALVRQADRLLEELMACEKRSLGM